MQDFTIKVNAAESAYIGVPYKIAFPYTDKSEVLFAQFIFGITFSLKYES